MPDDQTKKKDQQGDPSTNAQDDTKVSDAAEEVKEAAEEVKEAAEQAGEAAEKAEEGKTEAAEKGAEKAEAAAEKVEGVKESNSAKASQDKGKKEEPKKAHSADAQGETKKPAKSAEETRSEPSGKPASTEIDSGRFKNIIKDIEGLSALELSELVKALEERFGVSAAAPVAVAGPAAGVPDEGGDEEKANYNVVLTASGGNKIAAIKAVRECVPDLGLKEAKDLVDGAPKTVKENIPTKEAKGMKEKLEAAGATVELK